MTTTPTPEALRHRAAARRGALTLMILFTVASMAGNVVVVIRRSGAVEDMVLAGLAPAVLASMGHLLAQFVQAAMAASGVTSRVYWASVGAVSVIGLGAFILSFENLQTLAARQHNWFVAGVFPITLDLAILVSTGIHVVIGIANENDQNAGVLPHRSWLARQFGWWNTAAVRVEQTPVEHAAHAEQPVVSRAVPTPVTVAAQRGTTSAEQAVTSDVPRDTGDIPTEPIVVPHRVETAEQPVVYRDGDISGVVEQTAVSREMAIPETAEQSTVSRDSESDYAAEQDDEYRRIAGQLVTAGRTQAPVEKAAAVLRGADRGVTVRELADATGISPSGVYRLTKAAKELSAELTTAGT